MIRKLRIKLILASMLSLVLVLAVLFVFIDVLNYRGIVNDADRILDILAENDGSFPMNQDPSKNPAPEGNPPDETGRFSAEMPYESRYFFVFLSENDSVVSVNTGKIAAVDSSTAVSFAKDAAKSGHTRGFEDRYRYIVYTLDSETHVIFLDCGRDLTSFRNFLLTGIGVSAVGLLGVLLLLVFFSGRIVKPFSESYEKQKRFITDAGHELKTPLTIIDADADVLEMDLEEENEWIQDIRLQTKRLTELTNSLILLARMEERPQMQMQEFSLSRLVLEEAASFRTLAQSRGKTLSREVEPDISICGDEASIRRLLGILLDNGVKYSNAGGRIDLKLARRKNQVRLTVSNTVDSISKDDVPRLFDRFYRTDQSRNSRTGGYGLGLSIAAAITSLHKGKISASTPDEKSLVITVTLPV